MKSLTRKSFFFVFLFLISAIFNGCGWQNDLKEDARIVTDGIGREIKVPVSPRRIVATDIGVSELAMLLAPLDTIVGVSYFMDDEGICNLSLEAEKIPGRVERNVEHILQMEPDLVLVTSPGKDEARDYFTAIGIPVFTVQRPYTIDGIMENIGLIGEALGQEERAKRLNDAFRSDLEEIQSAVAKVSENKKRVLRIGMSGPTGSAESLIHTIITEAGCINVGAELGVGEGILSHEQVVASGAEIILMPTWDFKGRHNIHRYHELYENDPSLQNVPAVRGKNFLYIPSYFLVAQTPYCLFGIGALSEAAYGIEWESRTEKILPAGSVRKADIYRVHTAVSKENKGAL